MLNSHSTEPKLSEFKLITSEIFEKLKYYSDLNLQIIQAANKLHDTTEGLKGQEGPKKEMDMSPGLLRDLNEINLFLAHQNTVLQDSVNKFSSLI